MARQWIWAATVNAVSVGVASAPVSSTILAESAVFTKGSTVARILGNVTAGKAATSTGAPTFGMGVIILNDGVTSFPSPTNDPDAPWLYHMLGVLPAFDAAGDFSVVRFMVDVHGMRKINADSSLFFVGASDPAVALSYTYGLRVGLKLP